MYLITSFNDAADDLTKITGRKWICIEQAADNDFFEFIPSDKRLIDFSSYGRKDSNLHEAVKGFCLGNGLYYDYTTHDAKHPIVEAEELYQQYIWHLKHSLFTISLPVELTNPKRAMHLNPITCRWFEAAAAGTIIVGRKPDNKNFDNQMCKNLVTEINLEYGNRHIYTQLEEIWKNRLALHEKAKDIVITNSFRWTWKNRVNTILNDILS